MYSDRILSRSRLTKKRSDPDPDKKTRIRNTATKQAGIPDERSEFAGKTVQLIQKLKKLANEDSWGKQYERCGLCTVQYSMYSAVSKHKAELNMFR